MIHRDAFNKSWILAQRDAYPKADPLLIERQIYAFELLSLLKKAGKEFVFKGGTSLILLLPKSMRLSIDVDIVGNIDYEELAAAAQDSVFVEVEEDVRSTSRIPKKHFKFYYHSVIDDRKAYVLLDVLYGDHGYPTIRNVPVRSKLFNVQKEFTVSVPTINGILGDKLTAFAPGTIGVPYGKNKSMEIIKQLYDVGELFDACDNIDEIAQSYQTIHKQEISFRGVDYSVASTTDDTSEAAFILSQSRLRGGKETDKSTELQQGIRQIQSYLLGAHYRLDEARVSASKAALLATMINMGIRDIEMESLRFNRSKLAEIKEAEITGAWKILNRLKSAQTEAFYYWWKADQFRVQ